MLPEELWCLILLELPCKLVKEICVISTKFKELIDNYNIIEKRKMQGFPRTNGHCKIHDISDLLYHDKYEINENKIYVSIDKLKLTNNVLIVILDKLYELNTDLVRGDLIYFGGSNTSYNMGIFTFDGCEILNFEFDDNCILPEVLEEFTFDYNCILPKEFTVINNGVPINYWSDNEDLLYNDIIWFNHLTVKDQLLNNIEYINFTLKTKFVYENVIYYISYMIDEEYNITDEKDKFIDLLSVNNNLMLTHEKMRINKLFLSIKDD